MKRLWVLIALLALPFISSADIRDAYVYKVEICQLYSDTAAGFMEAFNKGWSIGDIYDHIRESAESWQFARRGSLKELSFSALLLAIKFNRLNIGDTRADYDFVRDTGMWMCLDADGDLTQIVLW